MITYQYKALSPDGAKVSGVVEAVDEFAAVDKIKATCPIVLKIEPVKEKSGIFTKEIGSKKIDTKSLAVMCSQFSIILQAGVTVAQCMEMIAGQTQDKKLRKTLEKTAEDVAQGNGVAASFEKNCPELPATFIETIRAGEYSGTLENSFATLEKYYEKSYKNKQKIKQVMTYPIFVVIVAIIVLAVVMLKVIPTISAVFSDLGGDLPKMTQIMIRSSEFFQRNFLWMMLVLILLVIVGKLYCNTEKGRYQWNRLMLKIPVLGNINLLNGCSQFANTMTALLEAGISVGDSIEVTAKVLDNYVLSVETSKMVGKISEGYRLGECMRKCDYYPTTLTEMCAIGENTGELEHTLETIATYYDNEADHATKQAISKLEPTIMVFLAIFAGFIVISIYLPMFTMYGMM